MEGGVSLLESKICQLATFLYFFSSVIPFPDLWNSTKVNFNQIREK